MATITVTKEMIEIGVDILIDYELDGMTRDEAVTLIFLSMLLALPLNQQFDSPENEILKQSASVVKRRSSHKKG